MQLLKNKQLRDEMGQEGRDVLRERFLLARDVEQYLDLCSALGTESGVRR